MSSSQATAAHAVKLSVGSAASLISRQTRLQTCDSDPIASGEDCFTDGPSGAMAKRQRPSHASPGAASIQCEGAAATAAAAAAAGPPVYLLDGERVLERLWLQVGRRSYAFTGMYVLAVRLHRVIWTVAYIETYCTLPPRICRIYGMWPMPLQVLYTPDTPDCVLRVLHAVPP